MKFSLQKDHAEESLNNTGADSKEMWKALKELWPLKSKSSAIKSLSSSVDDEEIANILNNHFSTVGTMLGSKFREVDYRGFPPNNAPIFNFTETNPQTVLTVINDLCPPKACGLDGITTRLLKDARDSTISLLIHTFNLSLTTKIFPNEWKVTVVTLTFKDGRSDNPTNYKPISLNLSVSFQ